MQSDNTPEQTAAEEVTKVRYISGEDTNALLLLAIRCDE